MSAAPIKPLAAALDPVELWKAIHGGCWPGPPPDLALSKLVEEVVAGLAVFNLAHSFADAGTAAGLKKLASSSLQKSLGALQKTVSSGQ
jgi:hypothetical protein